MATDEGRAKARRELEGRGQHPWRLNELVRRRRTRDDARRSLGVNLAEGLALTEFLSTFTGVCRK